jgi:hypothetical protein
VRDGAPKRFGMQYVMGYRMEDPSVGPVS